MFSDLVKETYPLGLSTEFGRSLLEPGGFFEVTEEEVLGHTHAVFKNRMHSVFEILTNAVAGLDQAGADRDYLADEDRRLTYREAYDAVARLAQVLRDEHGIGPGDRVGLYAANSLEWVVAFWSTLAVGGVVSAMNSYWSDPEAASAVELTRPVLVLADAKRAATLQRIGADGPVLVLDADLFARVTSGEVPELALAPTDEDDPVLYMFTSGTTGVPKAVVHRHRTVIGLYQCAIYNALLRMGGIPSDIPAPPRVLVGAPFFHLSALFGSIVMYTGASGLLVLRPGRFSEERVLDAIQDERITYWLSVGSSGPRVASHPRLADYDLSSIEMVMVGGAPVTPTVRRLLRRAFPGGVDNIRMGYTSTECGTNIATIGGEEFEADPESAGPIQDGLRVELRDEHGKPVPDGTDGNVFVSSPFVMLGYLDQPEETAAVLGEDGWLSMGDVGRLENGELYLNSRAGDLIFVSAENVYPSEVENRLEEHPDVVETCVAGIDDPITGQAVKAYVYVREGSTLTTTDLDAWVREGLPPYKVPSSWDLRTEPLPRNATGKILRSHLVGPDVELVETPATHLGARA